MNRAPTKWVLLLAGFAAILGLFNLALLLDWRVTEESLKDRFRTGSDLVIPPASDSIPHSSGDWSVVVDKETQLGIPVLVMRAPGYSTQPYVRLQKGVRVRYLKNIFSSNQPDLIYIPGVIGDRVRLRWQTMGRLDDGTGLWSVGDMEILDDRLYDFGVGPLFVKVRRIDDGVAKQFETLKENPAYPHLANLDPKQVVGYVTLETIIGDCAPLGDALWCASDTERLKSQAVVNYKNMVLYPEHLLDKGLKERVEVLADPTRWADELSGGKPSVGKPHPVYTANTLYLIMLSVVKNGVDEQERDRVVQVVRDFFDAWVIPDAVEVLPGSLSWPYHFEWNMNWGIRLDPPWYSPYASSRIAAASALLWDITGDERYRELAIGAANFCGAPIEDGGGEYSMHGFRFSAEYVYNTPPLPNVRVLDGEVTTVLALFDTARILGDSRILQIAMRQGASLAMALEQYQRPNGDLEFAQYTEDLPDSYRWVLWSGLNCLANAFKDKRFYEVACRFRDHLPAQSIKDNGN